MFSLSSHWSVSPGLPSVSETRGPGACSAISPKIGAITSKGHWSWGVAKLRARSRLRELVAGAKGIGVTESWGGNTQL